MINKWWIMLLQLPIFHVKQSFQIACKQSSLVNISLVAANARLQNVREERDQFYKVNGQIVAHLKTRTDSALKFGWFLLSYVILQTLSSKELHHLGILHLLVKSSVATLVSLGLQ